MGMADRDAEQRQREGGAEVEERAAEAGSDEAGTVPDYESLGGDEEDRWLIELFSDKSRGRVR